MNRYALLSEEEIEAATVHEPVDMPKESAGVIVMPIPPDAPAMPTRHRKHGEATAVYLYHDKEGRVLSAVCRFDTGDGKKEVLPLTLWTDGRGNLQWRFKGPPAPRSLYNADKLARNPDAPVVVVEGEKCADVASEIYPDGVVTTSPSGSQAAGKADWSPLAGRDVSLWGDADGPGADYVRSVSAKLLKLGCKVSIVDAMTLAAMAPDGTTREVAEGWDCADAFKEWPDLAALREAVANHTRAFEIPKPKLQSAEDDESAETYISVGDEFKMTAREGLKAWVVVGRGKNATVEEVWVSPPFEVVGACRNPVGSDWGKIIRFRDKDGRIHELFVSDAALQGEPAAVAALLAGEGLDLNRSAHRLLVTYLCRAKSKRRVTRVERTGWHSVAGHDVFVLREKVIGPHGSEAVILDAAAHGPYEARGSLTDWQKGVGAYSADHALFVLAISTALAGPLLYLAVQEGGGLNFYGPSSKGKTTAIEAASSVWGRGGSPGYVRGWRATASGLEGAAASASDTCLVLDELGLIEAREVAAALYSLSNGTGKARAARDGSLREPKSWRVLLLSTGEMPLGTKLAEDKGRRARGGQMVRLVDVSADRGKGFGAFDHGGATGDAAALSDAIKSAAKTSYGTAGPEFVRRLINEAIDGETVRAMVAEFVAAEVAAGSDGQVGRAAQRFGLIGAAGELATMLGVTPWREGAAREAAAWAFQRWVAGRGGSESAETRQAIEAVRAVIEGHESRFEPLAPEGEPRPINNRLGWRRGEGEAREYWVAPEMWKLEVCAGLDPLFVAKTLADCDLLRLQGGAGYQCKVNIGDGRRVNAYVVKAAILDGGGDAA
jgi:putative DNA primase/helicase